MQHRTVSSVIVKSFCKLVLITPLYQNSVAVWASQGVLWKQQL